MAVTHDPLCTYAALRLASECEVCRLIQKVRKHFSELTATPTEREVQ